MLWRLIYDEDLAEGAYLIGCQRTGEAIVFDPERDVDRYIDLAKSHGLKIAAVAETHIHADFHLRIQNEQSRMIPPPVPIL